MPVFHIIYGLRIASPFALPGFPVLADEKGPADVQIRLREQLFPQGAFPSQAEPLYVSADRDVHGKPLLRVEALAGGEYFKLSYCDGATFMLDRSGREIYADWPEDLTVEDACIYIAGPILGFLLHLRGIVPLHASAVSIDDHAVALMGPGGAGKSTTAAAFARFGNRVISDDVVALTEIGGHLFVCPGYPRVNLWDESARALFGDEEKLPLISSNWNKRFMPLDHRHQFEERALPLAAIYMLRNREPGLANPVIEEISGSAAFIALLGNTYMNRVVGPAMQYREFNALGRILAQVPLRSVRLAADHNSLLRLCETITIDAKRIISLGRIGDTEVRG